MNEETDHGVFCRIGCLDGSQRTKDQRKCRKRIQCRHRLDHGGQHRLIAKARAMVNASMTSMEEPGNAAAKVDVMG
jgi:hypothetical protein